MDSFGARLKHAREARGVSLPEIAASTKIAVAALEALERNDVRRLPGGIFGRAMVRSYALAVGLDADATVTDFQAEIVRAERERAKTKRAPEITSDDRQFLERQRRAFRLFQAISGVVVLGVILLVVWFFWGRPSGG
jgi:cytoskeletal protein RodZ